MTNVELMKANHRSLVARLKDDGTVHEYVVCSNYNGKDWDWGHYFQSLDPAVKYINDPNGTKAEEEHKKLLESIAYWMYFEGSSRTTEGNWIFYRSDVEEEFGVKLTDEDYDLITETLLCNDLVLDVWGERESGDGIGCDINFSTKFTEQEEW